MPVFPPSFASVAGIPNYQFFAGPTGSDGASGSSTAPFKTLYKACQAICDIGGGTVYYADDTQVGGPVTSQGLWFRGDGLKMDGWLGDVPMAIVGLGNASGGSVFQRPGAASMYGGSNSNPLFPAVWATATLYPKIFSNMFVNQSRGSDFGKAAPMRLGWDYNRNGDGSLRQMSIANASRASGSTIFTVTLPTGYSLIDASRSGNVVSLRYQLPSGVSYSPWFIGAIVKVDTGGDVDFPNIDNAIVTGQSDAFRLSPGSTVTINYTQAGADHATKSLTGTIKGHGVQAGDRVYVSSTEAEFPTCNMMLCTSVDGSDPTKFTVRDPYGYSPRTATVSKNNIGFCVKQERGRMQSNAIAVENIVLYNNSSVDDDFVGGPAIDYGSSDAVGLSINGSNLHGYPVTGPTSDQLDYDRTWCGLLADPGVGASSATVINSSNNTSQDGNVRMYMRVQNGAGFLDLDHWIQDTGAGTKVQPTVQLCSYSQFSSVLLDNIALADSTNNQPAVEDLTGSFHPGNLRIGYVFASSTNPVVAHCNGPNPIPSNLFLADNNPTSGPWQKGWQGNWNGAGSTVPHVGSNRKDSVSSARATNFFPAFASWQSFELFPAGVTGAVTGTSPFGQANAAVDITNANGGQVNDIKIGGYPQTLPGSGDGGYVAIGCWVNNTSGNLGQPVLSLGRYNTLRIDGNSSISLSPHIVGGVGWQWMTGFGKVTTRGDSSFALLLNVGAGHTLLYGFTAMYLPASTGDNDAYQWFNTFQCAPTYLPAGFAGTYEGQKIVAHCGLSTAKYYTVGGGSGQITIGSAAAKAIEVFDEAGNSLGVLRPSAFTVN